MREKVFFLIITLLSPVLAASEYFQGNCDISLQPCEITEFKIQICNDSKENKEYTPFIIGNQSWVKAVPESLNIMPGACGKITLFATPSCLAKEGEYAFEVGFKEIKSLKKVCKLSISSKATPKISIQPGYLFASKCSTANFLINLKNNENEISKVLIVLQTTPENIVSFSSQELILSGNEEKSIPVSLTIPCETQLKELNFNAIAVLPNNQKSVAVSLIKILDAWQFDNELGVENQSVNNDFEAEQSTYIANDFEISQVFEPGIEISKANFEERICLGETNFVDLIVHNKSSRKFSGNVRVKGGEAVVEKDAIEINPDSTSEIRLVVNPKIASHKKLPVKKNLTIVLSSDYVKIEKDFTFDFSNCYGENGFAKDENYGEKNGEVENILVEDANKQSSNAKDGNSLDANNLQDFGKKPDAQKFPVDAMANLINKALGFASKPVYFFAFLITLTIVAIFVSIYRKINE
jgi:hypothetical protein